MATPLAAPVRNWPSRSASSRAVISPVRASYRVTWNRAAFLVTVYALKPTAPNVLAAAGRTWSMTRSVWHRSRGTFCASSRASLRNAVSTASRAKSIVRTCATSASVR